MMKKIILLDLNPKISLLTNSIFLKLNQFFFSDDPIELIKREIYLYGPVLACFTAREDLQHYSSGNIQQQLGNFKNFRI